MTTPLHVRIADELRAQIVSGAMPVGTALPSEARLTERFDASRGTVRTALAALQHEGLIDRGQGRPPVVRESAAPQSFESFMSFTAWAQREGHAAGQRTIEIARRPACGPAAEALSLAEGTPVIEVLRLRTLDGRPAMLERSAFPEEVGRLLFEFDPDASSIYAHLLGRGIPLHSARHVIDAVGADEVDAEQLEVPAGSPLLRERRRVLSPDGVPLEYGEDRYRPDRVTFSINNVLSPTPGSTPEPRILKESS